MQWLTGPSSYTQITKNVGYAPLRTTLVNDKNGLYGWKAAQTLVQTNLDQLERLVPWQGYPGSNFSQIETLLVNAVSPITFQHADAASTLANAQKQANALLPYPSPYREERTRPCGSFNSPTPTSSLRAASRPPTWSASRRTSTTSSGPT